LLVVNQTVSLGKAASSFSDSVNNHPAIFVFFSIAAMNILEPQLIEYPKPN